MITKEKTIASICVGSFFFILILFSISNGQERLRGDLNGDGVVDFNDSYTGKVGKMTAEQRIQHLTQRVAKLEE